MRSCERISQRMGPYRLSWNQRPVAASGLQEIALHFLLEVLPRSILPTLNLKAFSSCSGALTQVLVTITVPLHP